MDAMMDVMLEMGLNEVDVLKWRAQLGPGVKFDLTLLVEGLNYLEVTKDAHRVAAFKALGFSPWACDVRDVLVSNGWFDYDASRAYGLVVVEDELGWDDGQCFMLLYPDPNAAWSAGCLAFETDIHYRVGPECLVGLTVAGGGSRVSRLEVADVCGDVVVDGVTDLGEVDVEQSVTAVSVGSDETAVDELEALSRQLSIVAMSKGVAQFEGFDEDNEGYGYGLCFPEAVRSQVFSVLGPYPLLDDLLVAYVSAWRVGAAVGGFSVTETGAGLFVSKSDMSVDESMAQLIGVKRAGFGAMRVGQVIDGRGCCYLLFVREDCRMEAYMLYGRNPFADELLTIPGSWVQDSGGLMRLRCDIQSRCAHVSRNGKHSFVDFMHAVSCGEPPVWLPGSAGSFPGFSGAGPSRVARIVVGGIVEETVGRVGQMLNEEEAVPGRVHEYGELIGMYAAAKANSVCVGVVDCDGVDLRMMHVEDGACVLLVRADKLEGFVPLKTYSSVECLSVLRRLEFGPSGAKQLRCFLPPYGYGGVEVGEMAGVPRMPVVAYFRRFPGSVTHRQLEDALEVEAVRVGISISE